MQLTKVHLSPFYEIEEAADGEEALEIMEHFHAGSGYLHHAFSFYAGRSQGEHILCD